MQIRVDPETTTIETTLDALLGRFRSPHSPPETPITRFELPQLAQGEHHE